MTTTRMLVLLTIAMLLLPAAGLAQVDGETGGIAFYAAQNPGGKTITNLNLGVDDGATVKSMYKGTLFNYAVSGQKFCDDMEAEDEECTFVPHPPRTPVGYENGLGALVCTKSDNCDCEKILPPEEEEPPVGTGDGELTDEDFAEIGRIHWR
ncbi:hypothetical protein MRY87_05820 [bacterium]|nr:hypothetical protein [bacterium]